MSKQITLINIACDIAAHLKRFAGDLRINRPVSIASDPTTLQSPYMFTSVSSQRGSVWVVYDNMRGGHRLTRAEAEAYLAWLDAGNVGTHLDMAKSAKSTTAAAPSLATEVDSVVSRSCDFCGTMNKVAVSEQYRACVWICLICAEWAVDTLRNAGVR